MYLPLNREHSRKLALLLIAAGILLMPDIIAPTPFMDALLNVPLAMFIAALTGMTFFDAVMWTFVFSFTMLAIGLLIYPYNTKRLVAGRLKAAAAWMFSHPVYFIVSIVIFITIYMWGNMLFGQYEEQLKVYVQQLVQQTMGGA